MPNQARSRAISSELQSEPRILDLEEIRDEAVGGKASSLAGLIRMGLRVPGGFAILGATPERLPDDLAARYLALGAGPVAVRSSALDEDQADASWAGQYETILGVEGEEALEEAVRACLRSLTSERATAYHDLQERTGENAMCVVVQKMVEPGSAGVLFTVDPVTSRRTRAVIDAVEGLGEALVSGEATPDHYVLDRMGETRSQTLISDSPILDDAARRALLREALEAEAIRGEPLDLEWAIDGDGRIWWLQARPITTLQADLNELDTPLRVPDHVYTRCNVGEMFPGACTPLSFSFTARGIDVGMQMMHVRVGVQPKILPEFKTLGMFYGHLFINLTTTAEPATQALGSTTDQLCLSLCGRIIKDPPIKSPPPPPLLVRLPNTLRYVAYVLGQKKARRNLKELIEGLDLHCDAPGAAAMWQRIDSRFDASHQAMDWHLISSAGAGILTSTILSVIAKGGEPTMEHHAEVAALLAGAKDVESADIAAGAERILDRSIREPGVRARFAEAEPEAALDWLRGQDSGEAGAEFRRYLERHGHRAIKELELRQPEWREDPMPLVGSLQASARARLKRGNDEARARTSATTGREDPLARHSLPLRWLTRLAHQTVRSREETKSGLVKVTTLFKVAYRELGRRMVDEGLLEDMDAVFFLTHSELAELIRGSAPELAGRALARREIHPHQDALEFPEVFAGEPEPVVHELSFDPAQKAVTGASVSRGRVVGIARVVHTPAEAAALVEGEILVAPITDVGWTPYFSMISGLVTDVGSAVSHGAVVAREFGLPAVVNTRVGTRVFETGDCLVLDGDRGTVHLATDADRLP